MNLIPGCMYLRSEKFAFLLNCESWDFDLPQVKYLHFGCEPSPVMLVDDRQYPVKDDYLRESERFGVWQELKALSGTDDAILPKLNSLVGFTVHLIHPRVIPYTLPEYVKFSRPLLPRLNQPTLPEFEPVSKTTGRMNHVWGQAVIGSFVVEQCYYTLQGGENQAFLNTMRQSGFTPLASVANGIYRAKTTADQPSIGAGKRYLSEGNDEMAD